MSNEEKQMREFLTRPMKTSIPSMDGVQTLKKNWIKEQKQKEK